MKHEIEIPDLPEGWEAVSVKLIELESSDSEHAIYASKVLAKKKQPRRIVLEETGEIRQSCYLLKIDDGNLILPPGREYKIVDDKNETQD